MTEPHDPFEMLQRPHEAILPNTTFAAALRRALERAADGEPIPTDPREVRRRHMPTFETTLTPYLCAPDAKEALAFYAKAFGASETMRLVDPKDGRIGHSEFAIGDVRVYLSDEYPEVGVRNPLSAGLDFAVFTLVLRVEDADAVFNQAVAAGARVHSPLTDQFYGERSGTLVDPYGYVWMISSPIDTFTSAEMQNRYEEAGQ